MQLSMLPDSERLVASTRAQLQRGFVIFCVGQKGALRSVLTFTGIKLQARVKPPFDVRSAVGRNRRKSQAERS